MHLTQRDGCASVSKPHWHRTTFKTRKECVDQQRNTLCMCTICFVLMPPSASLGLFLSCTNAISQRNRGPYNPMACFFGSFKTPRPSSNSEPGYICVFYLFGGSTISLEETQAASGVKWLFWNPMGLRSISDTSENKAGGFHLPVAEWTQTMAHP